jgi:hypothetical protein
VAYKILFGIASTGVYLGNLAADGRVVLKWMEQKHDMNLRNGFQLAQNGVQWRNFVKTFGFH